MALRAGEPEVFYPDAFETGHNVLLITVEYVGATSLPIIAGKSMYYNQYISLFFDKSCALSCCIWR